MWGFLGSLLAGPLTTIVGKIADAKIALAQAQTDQEKIHAEERVKGLESQRDVLVAEGAGSRINAIVRAALAVPTICFLWKTVIWDKVFGLGSTEDLSDHLWYVTMIVVGFYYAHWTVGAFKR